MLEETHNENNEIDNIEPESLSSCKKNSFRKKIDIHSIKGSGKNGLVLKEDVMRSNGC